MFRRWLSNFIRKNKGKMSLTTKIIFVVILFVALIYNVFSNMHQENDDIELGAIYKPQDTVISGHNIEKEEYEEDNGTIETFTDYCNKNNTKNAYEMLSDECKSKLYPTLKDFEDKYHKIIFNKGKEVNIQSWINERNYTTYKVKFTDDFMSTGIYDNTEKYEDYITITIEENNKQNKKLNINGFIKSEKLDKETNTDELNVQAVNLDIYMTYVIYTIDVKNVTDKDIILCGIDSTETIKLLGSNGANYKLDSTNLRLIDLLVESNEKKSIVLKFSKQYGSKIDGKGIEFNNFINNYTKYIKDRQNYNDFKKVIVNL